MWKYPVHTWTYYYKCSPMLFWWFPINDGSMMIVVTRPVTPATASCQSSPMRTGARQVVGVDGWIIMTGDWWFVEVAIGRVGSVSGLGRASRVSLTFWKKSGRVGSIYMLCFFRSLIDFNWIESHLISGRVGSGWVRVGSGQFDFLKKSDRIGFGSGRVCRIGSDSATSSDSSFLLCFSRVG
jgi:hypothetical protein